LSPGARALLIIVAMFVVVGVSAVGYGMCEASSIVGRQHEPTLTLTEESLAGGDAVRGKRLVSAVVRCGECHAPDLGGRIVVDSGIGRFAAPNITSGGRGSVTNSYGAVDWLRAIRHGVSPDKRGLWLMPVARFRALGQADLRDMIAYLRKARPVDRASEPSELGVFGKTLLGYGRLPLIAADTLAPEAPVPTPPAPAPDAAYGNYLATIAGCGECHGANLEGGPAGSRSAPALKGAESASWSVDAWKALLRRGVRPDGSEIDEEAMPVRDYMGLTDREIEALREFVAAPNASN